MENKKATNVKARTNVTSRLGISSTSKVASSYRKPGISPSVNIPSSVRKPEPIPRNTSVPSAKYGNVKAINNKEDHLGEEAKRDVNDDVYSSLLTSSTMKALLDKANHRIRGDIDTQISSLQKHLKNELESLNKTKLELDSLYILKEEGEFLSCHKDVCLSLSDEPLFAKGKSFEELMTAIDRTKNKLPCKDVCIPEGSAEFADFQATASQLLQSLETVSTVYGSHQTPISLTASKLNEVQKAHRTLENSKPRIEVLSTEACGNILHESIMKTSTLDLF